MFLNYKDKNIVGTDETGVGDYLTPLVAAAVFVPKENVSKLIKMGIKDSKELNDKEMLILFEKMKKLIKSSVRILSQKQYNYLNKKYNANELKMILHMKSINSIEERVKGIDFIIMDAFSNSSSLDKYRKILLNNKEAIKIRNKVLYIEKAEKEHVSVAAASIVARSYFLKMMESQNKKWNMIFPFGTNKIVEKCAKKFIKLHGEENLYEVAKISFKTTKKII